VYSQDAADIAKCEDGGTVGITGFDKAKFQEAEFGGITETGIAQEDHARMAADRGIGINDIQRGSVSGAPLATEILQAAGASNVRTADLSEQFQAGVRRQLTTVAWYMWRFDKVKQPMTQEDVQQLGLPPELMEQIAADPKAAVYWSGAGNREPFDSLELAIEPYSMKRTDEPMMQARAMQAIELATGLAPAIVQNPHIRWKQLLEKLGDSMNWPDFADILDEQVAMEMTALMLQSQTQPAAGEPKPKPKPRMQADLVAPKPAKQGYASPAGAKKKPAMAGASK
jgi:hypothetical protein